MLLNRVSFGCPKSRWLDKQSSDERQASSAHGQRGLQSSHLVELLEKDNRLDILQDCGSSERKGDEDLHGQLLCASDIQVKVHHSKNAKGTKHREPSRLGKQSCWQSRRLYVTQFRVEDLFHAGDETDAKRQYQNLHMLAKLAN